VIVLDKSPPPEDHVVVRIVGEGWGMTNDDFPASGAGAKAFPPDAVGLRSESLAPAPSLPKQIGPYHVLGRINEGGMGSVYRAEQRRPIQRTVAIKVIKLGFDTKEVIARFDSERQALARMDHPNVAKVLDAGATDTGRPYFVMEYVPGVPITKFCDENKLSIDDRLDLFCQVCDAINHAHTKALIHRDIKASNVLAFLQEGKPTVKVIDFGIAKALTSDRLTEQTFYTDQGRIVGTYDSMSPEQADASPDIDTRTDVYSLGVLLYELLTGAKPFDHETLAKAADQEIKRIIREVEPPRPSAKLSSLGDDATRIAGLRQEQLGTLMRQLRTELEWIPLKAIRKERGRRYASALELAQDVRNFLEDRPLLAGPESRAYRLRKFIRRNRTGVAASAAMILLTAAGVAFYIHGIRAEQRKTEAALIDARQQREEATKQTAIAQAVSQFQSDMLASADPAKLLGDKVTVLQAIQGAARVLDAGKLRDQPLVEAANRFTIGQTLASLGRYEDAAKSFDAALRLRQAHSSPESLELADTLVHLGAIQHALDDRANGESSFRRAVDIYHAHPEQTSTDGRLATAEFCLAWELLDERKLNEAEPVDRAALGRLSQAAVNLDSGLQVDVSDVEKLLHAESRLVRYEPHIFNGDLLWYGSLSTRERVAKYLECLGDLLHDQQWFAQSESSYRRAIEIMRQESHPNPLRLGELLENLGLVLEQQDKLPESEKVLRECLKAYEENYPIGHAKFSWVFADLATVLWKQHKLAEAETFSRQSLDIRRKTLPPGHLQVLNACSALGRILASEQKLGDAEPLLREALEGRLQKLGPHAELTKLTATALCDLLDQTDRHAEATALRNQCDLSSAATKPATAPANTMPR
jgi:serine/threonine protein kinase/Tfp pilus assembly protein PilF